MKLLARYTRHKLSVPGCNTDSYNFSSILNQTSNLNVSDLSTNVQFRLLIKLTRYIGYK